MSLNDSREGPFTKRQVLQMIGGASAVGLAGCLGGDGDDDDDLSVDEVLNDRPDEPDNGPVQGGTLRIGVDPSLQTMDPRSYGGLVSIMTFGNLYSQILQWRQEEDGYYLEGDLAEEWGWEEETEFVIELNEDATFWNGDPVTADHVVHTIESLDAPEYSVGDDFPLDLMEPVEVDDHTVLIDADEPLGPLEASFGYTLGIVHKDIDQERDITFDPMGSGPFVLEDVSDDEVIMEANEDYWKTDDEGNQLPYLDRLEWTLFDENPPRVNALEAGELDFIDDFPISDIQRLGDNDDTYVIAGEPGARRGIVHFNVTEPPFDDVHVRRAFLHMMDWESYTEGIWEGVAEPTGEYVQATPPATGWDNGAENPYHGVDVEAAEAELEQSQYSRDEISGFTNILTQTDDQSGLAQEALLESVSNELGIDYELRTLDDESWRSQNADADGWGFTFMNWSGGWDPDHFITMAWGGEFFNWGGYDNEEVNELFMEGKEHVDQSTREGIYQEMNAEILDDAGKYFSYHAPDIQAARTNVHGIEAHLDLMTYFEWVWMEEE